MLHTIPSLENAHRVYKQARQKLFRNCIQRQVCGGFLLESAKENAKNKSTKISKTHTHTHTNARIQTRKHDAAKVKRQ